MSKGIVFKTRSNEKIYPCPYFPVGSIYMSLSSTNPSTYFGGTWTQIKDSFLLGAGNSYSAGSTGGSKTHYHSTSGHTLTINEIPSHKHEIYQNAWGYGSNKWAVVTNYGDSGGSNIAKLSSNGVSDLNPGSGDSAKGLVNADYTGGGASHSHGNTGSSSSMPPYYVVYIWRRTA